MADLKFKLSSYPLKLRRPFTTSKQSASEKDTLFARFGQGIGEGSPSLHYGAPPAELIPLTQELLDQHTSLRGAQQIEPFLANLPGYLAAARCGMEMAYLDHVAQEQGVPLYDYLHLEPPSDMLSSITITQGTEDELKQQVETYHQFGTFKLKVGFDGDLAMIESILNLKEARLRLDANGGWDVNETIERMKSLSGYPIEFVEQPVNEPTLRELDKIKTKVECTLLLDEAIKSAEDIERFHPVCDGVSLKLAKCGGIKETLRLAEAARERGLQLLLGCMVESSVGISAACHISSLFDYLDLDSILLIENDPAWGAHFDGEHLILPEGPGLGLVREETTLA